MTARFGILDLWGCAGGPVTALAPQTRLAAGFFLFFACMVAAPDRASGFAFLSGTVLAWLLFCRPPLAAVGRMLLLGLVTLLPFFLLTPWTGAGPPSPSWLEGPGLLEAAAVPWRILAKGLGGMLLSLTTVSSVGVPDFYDGISRLPLPRALVGLLTQILHQAGVLIGETRRITAAVAVRGASGRAGSAWHILTSLPRVWLPRIAARTDRVASAMDLRGFDPAIPCFRKVPMRLGDWAVLLSAAAWLALAVVIRLGASG